MPKEISQTEYAQLLRPENKKLVRFGHLIGQLQPSKIIWGNSPPCNKCPIGYNSIAIYYYPIVADGWAIASYDADS